MKKITKKSWYITAAVMAVLSQISIPLPTGVPVTLQTFAVALCGYVLGVGMGGSALAVYLALGAVGLPVFAGFSGGVGSFLGVTGGFLWGFFLMSLLCGLGLCRLHLSLLRGPGRLRLLLGLRHTQQLLHARSLVLLGKVLEDLRKFAVFQHLHVVLGRSGVVG